MASPSLSTGMDDNAAYNYEGTFLAGTKTKHGRGVYTGKGSLYTQRLQI